MAAADPRPERDARNAPLIAASVVLRDTARATEALRESGLLLDSLEITHRPRFEHAGLVGYRLRGTGLTGQPATTFGYVRWESPERVAALHERWRDGRSVPGPFGDGVRAVGSLPALLFLLPNDDRLELLPVVTDSARLAGELALLPALASEGWRLRDSTAPPEILRYVPEDRFVARLALESQQATPGESRTRDIVLRSYADDRGDELLAELDAWREAGAAMVLPRSLGVMRGGRLHVEAAAEGGTLSSAVRTGRAEPEAVATAIRKLHGARVTLRRKRPVDMRLAGAHEHLGELREHRLLDDTGMAAVAGPLTAALPAERAPCPLHGSLDGSHLICGPSGVVFVGLARRAMGDPLDDWGGLIAHLTWESRALLPAGAATAELAGRLALLARASAPERSPSDLAFFTSCTYLELAAGALDKDTPGAAAEARLGLQLAREALAGAR